MARRRGSEEGGSQNGSPAWMGTYGDMVTLLLTFFILLFSMSSIEVSKFEAFIKSFEGSVGILQGENVIGDRQHDIETGVTQAESSLEELKQIAEDLEGYLEEEGFEQQVEIDYNEQYVRLNFLDGVLFDPGRAELKIESFDILEIVASRLLTYEGHNIKVEGHTDTVPMNSYRFPNNWYLSAARAITVAEYFINEKGMNPRQLSAEGFGEYAPIASNETVEGRAQNRRVEIKILSKQESDKVNSSL